MTAPTFYVDEAGETRWHVTAPNGRILADSGEGYSTADAAAEGFADLLDELGVTALLELVASRLPGALRARHEATIAPLVELARHAPGT